MKRDDEGIRIIQDLLAAQPLGVLATSMAGQPYTSLVAFVADADLRQVWFATERATRKYENLRADGRAALLVDSRATAGGDLRQAVAVTLRGCVREVPAGERSRVQACYLAKHPQLAAFVTAPNCALLCLAVQHCQLVQRFQDVREFVFDGVPQD